MAAILFCSLTTTGAWAQDAAPGDSLPGAVDGSPVITAVTPRSLPKRAPSSDYTYTYKGVKYTYITENNYTRYFNPSVHKPSDYGWYTDADGWYVNAEKAYITAASIDADNFPSSGEAYIVNDLVGFVTDHTHLGCIADNGFRFMPGVRRVYFQDCDAMSYTANSDFYFFIGDGAFADCENLEEVNLMQWTTSGSNHWQALPPTAVKRIWGSMLDNSPKAWIRVGTSVYQQYLGSQTWVQVRNRITTFEHSSDDITVNGAVYSFLKAEDGTALSNADEQHEEIMKTLRLWNADYREFNAASLLSDKSRTTDNANIWYTTVKGVDANYLKSHDGVLRIYNDPGSYYNYKTIAIRKGAFAGCDDLKAVEFYKTNGRSENSYSEMRMVIENGAFKGCENLKEIRMYVWSEEGDDHWEILGPKDVIPGDNIFGFSTTEELLAAGEQETELPPAVVDVRIVVSPMRYNDFINDPNWAPYVPYIVAADYEPARWDAETVDGLVYDYSTKTAGIASTDQVVTQELSWWNVPIKIYEIITIYQMVNSLYDKASSIITSIMKSRKNKFQLDVITEANNIIDPAIAMRKEAQAISPIAKGVMKNDASVINTLGGANAKDILDRPFLDFATKKGWVEGNRFVQNFSEILRTDELARNWLGRALQETTRLWTIYSYQQAKPGYDMLRQFYLEVAKELLSTQTGGTVALVAEQTALQGSFAAYNLFNNINEETYAKALTNNIISNMHKVSYDNTLVFTPDKKLVYHVYVQKPAEQREHYTIYHDIGRVYNYRTVGIDPDAFKGNTTVKRIDFAESYAALADSYVPMLLTIPDSAFAGCTSLDRLELIYETREGGKRGLGPENFVLCGNNIFAGCDSTKLKIIIPSDRKQDFLENESWAQYQRFFAYEDVPDKVEYTEFGVKYGYVYKNNTTKLEERISSHTIDHLYAIGPDDNYIKDNNGALGFFNDIGSWNNYKLDYAKKGAFRKNQNIKSVSFWDVAGWLWTGDAYTDLQMGLQDSCFAECPNLEHVDMLYLRTDGSNIAEPLTPTMLQLGDGVFDNSPKVRFKMTDRQMDWFAADTTWAKYQDRFLPCLFLPADPVVVSKLSDLKYRTDVARAWYDNNASKWGDWLDITRVTSDSYLNGKFSGNTDLRSFPDFKRFELVGLTQVGGSWFQNCENLNAIELPSTIKHIGGWAFYGCSKLKEITIPAAVETIDACAFQYSGLKTVRCEGITPAKLDYNVFDLTSYSGFAIYVPAEAVDAYKQAWPNYAQYIKSAVDDRVLTVVDVDQPGKLAEKLGLTMKMDGDRLRSVSGAYWKYDSLTVRGHLNGLDVGVLRHLMGADAWDSDPTDGRLRYLDLHDAHLDKDTKYSYNLWGVDEYLEKENWVGEYMFYKCNALETLILPASVTEIGENAFEKAKNLRRLFISEKLEKYTRDLIQGIPAGLEELVFMTDRHATSESDDPWEGPIAQVYTKKSQLDGYISDPALTKRAQSIYALFDDDQVMNDLMTRRCYFPSQYLNVESTKNPRGSYMDGDGYFFYRDKQLKTFDEFQLFSNIREMDHDFENCAYLERITLPSSLERIGYDAFTGCEKLGIIHISADSVPVLERNAFRDLPADFQIIVPKTHVKRYREKWAQYADHIVGEDEDFRNGIIEVTLTEPNTLAEKLGLTTTSKVYQGGTSDDLINGKFKYVASVTGDYSNIRALKVNGPISGADFTVMRYLAGYDVMADLNDFLQFSGTRNYFGRLEYIDLYDANIVPTEYMTDGISWTAYLKCLFENDYDILPGDAFGECYSLKTLILPRSCKEVRTSAFIQCEYLETLVIGDECEKFNWNALDDCASMTRMYILSKKKMEMDQDNWLVRAAFNNYSPTFDAFYVRPSLYNEYVADNAYTGSQQRTNSISSGAFEDDESFAAFAAHAAATEDDLRQINDITGWFRNHTGVIDLNALQYTCIDSLRTADMEPLTQMRNITLPATIKGVGKDAFKNAAGLRYVDMSQCTEYAPTLAAEGGVRSLGIGENTLAYVPAQYGESADVNVAVGDSTSGVFHAQTFRLVDGLDYCVPFAVTADKVENTRTLQKSSAPYTVCLPYALDIPAGAKVYRLSGRGTNELIFAQHTERMEAMQPYLVWAENADALLSTANVTLPSSTDGSTVGRQQYSVGYTLRGTLNSIDNQEAVELGAYVMNDDSKWHPVLSDTEAHKAVTIPAFRCFLLQSRQNGTRAIGMTLEDVNGIEQLRTIDADGTDRVYDLSGRRIDGNVRGIVIKNGKKMVSGRFERSASYKNK